MKFINWKQRIFSFCCLAFGVYILNSSVFSDTAPAAQAIQISSEKITKSDSLKILAVGDFVHPDNFESSEIINNLGKSKYEYIRPIIRNADIAFINLESPFTDQKPFIKKKYAFVSDPAELEHILWAGFNMFSLANNHMYDAGLEGIRDTLNHLSEKTSKLNLRRPYVWAGAGLTEKEAAVPAEMIVKNDYKITFFAYGNNNTIHNNIFEANKAAKQIGEIKKTKGNNLIIVSIHDGEEYTHHPKKKYRNAYRKVIDAGADIIFAHHPHVVQGIERYKHGIIFYSLGNFSMGTLHPEDYTEYLFSIAAVINCELSDKVTPLSVEILPLYVDNKKPMTMADKEFELRQFVPIVPNEPFATKLLKKVIDRSEKIKGNKTVFKIENSRIKIDLMEPLP